MFKFVLLLLIVLLSGCQSQLIRDNDFKEKWRGKDVSTLDYHQEFAQLYKYEKSYEDHKEIIFTTSDPNADSLAACRGTLRSDNYYTDFTRQNNIASCSYYNFDKSCTYRFEVQNNVISEVESEGFYCQTSCSFLPDGC